METQDKIYKNKVSDYIDSLENLLSNPRLEKGLRQNYKEELNQLKLGVRMGIYKLDDVYEFSFGGSTEESKETYQKWKSLVNMSKGELEKFYNSQEGKDAGLSPGEAKEEGIDSGRESARWIMKMKDTPASDWTPDMWRWAKKQISFISRMRGNKGPLYDERGNKTRKHTSLLIWGHNPEKFADGGLLNSFQQLANKYK